MKHILLTLTLLFNLCLLSSLSAQEDSLLTEVEAAILKGDIEFAQANIPHLDVTNEFSTILNLIASNADVSYSQYLGFFQHIIDSEKTDLVLLNTYIQNNIQEPESKSQIDYPYVRINWLIISNLDDVSEIELSTKRQQKLEAYIDQFNPNDRDVKRAKILANTHHLVMFQIKRNAKDGMISCLESEKIAREIKDTNLIICSLYFYADFLISTGDLDEFIRVSEESLALDNQYQTHSDYHTSTLFHLINAYTYQGDKEKETLKLLMEVYNNPKSKLLSYSYFAGYLGTVTIPSPESDYIFNLFEVTDLDGFSKNLILKSKEDLNLNDLYYVYFEISKMYNRLGQNENAYHYSESSIKVIRRIYTEELAESLASYETKQLKQQQEIELEKEQEKTKMYFIIAILGGFSFLLSIFYLVLRQSKERELEKKNIQITKQRDEIQKKDSEKAILLKEIHHRVKNNFQIVSSLLELQASSIEDETFRAIALEGKNRINAMALIHKKLYQHDDLKMFFDEYIKKLVGDITKIYNKDGHIELVISVPHISFDIDTSIPLGLMVNELVTNALKYGMTNKNPTLEVSIEKSESDFYLLHVRDNGDGLPSDFDINKLQSLGLQLVTGLAKQLHGKLTFRSENGCHFFVSFKDIHVMNFDN